MRCRKFTTAEACLVHAGGFLTHREIKNTMILGMLLAHNRQALMVAVGNQAVELVAVMMRGDHLMLSCAGRAALSSLADWLRETQVVLPGIVGPRSLAEDFAACWEKRSATKAVPGLALRLYRFDQVTARNLSPGELQRAGESDLPWLSRWVVEMFTAIRASTQKIQDNQVSIAERVRKGEIFYWFHNGRPVSMIGFQPSSLSGRGGQVNMVYTAPDQRGRGFARTSVAVLCGRLFAGGWTYCLVFADKQNPAAKKMYGKAKMIGSYQNFTFT